MLSKTLKRYLYGVAPNLLRCALLLAAMPTYAATVEDAVKAGFIYNFTKYIVWPANANVVNTDNFNVCVTGQDALLGSLEALYGKLAEQKPIIIRRNVDHKDLHDCDIVYVADKNIAAVQSTIRAIGQLPILTISDFPGFINNNGMIGLVRDGDRVGFEINLQSARLSNINISSQLLKLAKKVKGRD